MGIAGVAIMFALFFLYKSFASLYIFFAWRNKEVVEGTFGCLQSTSEEGKTRVNTFDLSLYTTSGVVLTEYKEALGKTEASKIKEGDKATFFYNPVNEKYRRKDDVIRDLWFNPLMCVVCVGVLMLCFLLTTQLE